MMRPIFSRDFGLLCFASLLFFASYHLLTPVFPLYLQAQNFSGLTIGSLVAGFMVASLLIRPWIGKLSDEVNKTTLMLIGIVGFGICPLLYLWAQDPNLLYLVRILHGASFAMFYTASGSYLVSVVPAERKAEGIGYYSNAIKIAMAFSPGLAVFLAHREQMVEVFWLSAGLSLLVAACVLTMTPLKPAGTNVSRKGKWINPAAIYPGVIMATNSLAFGALIPFVPLLANEKHLDSAQWFYTIYAACLIASRFLTARLSDQYGRSAVVLPGMAFVIVSLVLLGYSANGVGFLTMAGLYGLAAGTIQPALMAMAAERAVKQEQGSAVATFTMLSDLGIALGSFLMGSLGSSIGYHHTLLWIALGTTGGWILLWFGARQAAQPLRRVSG